MNTYLVLKTLHVLSAMVVLGTGIGIAWYTLRGWQSRDRRILSWISRETIIADWLFTATACLLLLASAAGMLISNPAWLHQRWLHLAMMLTAAVFLLWLPVLALQYRLRKASAGPGEVDTTPIMGLWCLLGACALPLMVAIVYLMVAKPAL
ncbi:DUF2269 family protein [Microbulbifer sp. TYP-18]|uniref:DUF2269 family protein n=1 Tax=Microbulbifer sp. TYP-18 TaxID=3230024 RepID=UPI0034C67B7D